MNSHLDQGLNARVARALAESAHLKIDPSRLEYLPDYPLMVGGFGTVRVAKLDDQIMAIKELRITGGDNDRARFSMRVARELKVWAPLDHPNLLKLSGFYVNPEMSIAQFICPFYSHGHIRNYINVKQPDHGTRLRLVQDTALGLQHLHKLHIVHGDIKELNVLVHPEPRALLCDYGLAKMISGDGIGSGLTTTGNPMSLRCASPEVLQGSRPGLAGDLWAWGCLVLMIVTDIAPYKGTSDVGCVPKIMGGIPPAIVSTLDMSEALRGILHGCWNTDPTARPSIEQCVEIIDLVQPRQSPISMKILEGHTDAVYSVAFSPDGSLLASGAADEDVRVWNSTRSYLTATMRCMSTVYTVAFSPDGRRLAVGLLSGIQIWGPIPDMSTASPGNSLLWTKITTIPASSAVLSLAWSPDNSELATVQKFGGVGVWDAASGMWLQLLAGTDLSVVNDGCVAFSPDGVRLAYCRGGNTVSISEEREVWANISSKWHHATDLVGHSHWVTFLSFVLDANRVASGSRDGTIRIWDLSSRKVLMVLQTGEMVDSFTFSPDGERLASLTFDGVIQLWDTTSRKLIKVLAHDYSLTSVSWSPDDKWIAYGSTDGAVRREPAPRVIVAAA